MNRLLLPERLCHNRKKGKNVILNEVKNLDTWGHGILRYAQDDRQKQDIEEIILGAVEVLAAPI